MLLRLSFSIDKKIGQFLLCTFSAFIVVFGMKIKITVLIPVIASFIVLFLCKKFNYKKNIIIFSVMFLIFNICFDLFTRSTYLGKKTYDNVDPVIAWIALGLKNDGSIF